MAPTTHEKAAPPKGTRQDKTKMLKLDRSEHFFSKALIAALSTSFSWNHDFWRIRVTLWAMRRHPRLLLSGSRDAHFFVASQPLCSVFETPYAMAFTTELATTLLVSILRRVFMTLWAVRASGSGTAKGSFLGVASVGLEPDAFGASY